MYTTTATVMPHIRDKVQKPAKNFIRKIREIEWLYLCLQRECEVHKKTETEMM